VPEDLIAICCGQIPQTYEWYLRLEEIKKGIKSVCVVNIDTDNRLAITAAVRE